MTGDSGWYRLIARGGGVVGGTNNTNILNNQQQELGRGFSLKRFYFNKSAGSKYSMSGGHTPWEFSISVKFRYFSGATPRPQIYFRGFPLCTLCSIIPISISMRGGGFCGAEKWQFLCNVWYLFFSEFGMLLNEWIRTMISSTLCWEQNPCICLPD